jgi:hypothetical protein
MMMVIVSVAAAAVLAAPAVALVFAGRRQRLVRMI